MRSRKSRMNRLAALLLFLPLARCSRQPAAPASAQASSARPAIVFMTDFGTANDAVAICRAVIYGIAPDVRITDITHQVTPFSIEEASRFLYGVTPYYPEGTVFLVVVDPGVGTSRRAGVREGNHQSALDDPGATVVDVSWAGYFFASGGASGGGLGV